MLTLTKNNNASVNYNESSSYSRNLFQNDGVYSKSVKENGINVDQWRNERRNWLIGGIAVAALGIGCACAFNQTLEGEYTPAIRLPDQAENFPDVTENFPLIDVQFEPPLDLASRISQLDRPVFTDQETGIWKKLNSFYEPTFYSMPAYEEAIKINLYDLREMTKQERQVAIEKFELQEKIDFLGKDAFFERLNELDKQTLKLANLADLKFYGENFKLKYALLTNKEFNQLTLEELENVSFNETPIIIERLKNISKESVLDNEINENVSELSLVSFSRLNSEQINRVIHKIPEKAFSLLSSDQLMGLDFQKISQRQVYQLFRINSNRRISLLSLDQLKSVFCKLNNSNLRYDITDDQFKQLNLGDLKADQIGNLLANDPAKRIAFLSIDQVKTIFPKLSSFNLRYITDDQFKELNLSALNADQIQGLFAKNPAKRIALLSIDQVQSVLAKLSSFSLRHITDDQIKKLNLQVLNTDQIQSLFADDPAKRIGLLSVDQLKSIFDNLNAINLKHISNDQFKQLNLAITLNADQINNMLFKDPAKRIPYLSGDQVQSIFAKLSSFNLRHITDDQIKQLNLANFKVDQIKKLFVEDPARRIALLSLDQLKFLLDKLGASYLRRYLTEEQFKKLLNLNN